MQFLDGPVNPPPEQIEEELTYRLGEWQLPADLTLRLHSIKRRLAASPNAAAASFDYSLPTGWHTWRTPTRSNAGRRCGRDSTLHSGRPAYALYPVGPDAPAGAALSPQEVASWLVTTNDARVAFQ